MSPILRPVAFKNYPTGAPAAHLILVGAAPFSHTNFVALCDQISDEIRKHPSLAMDPALSIQGIVPSGPSVSASLSIAGSGGLTFDRDSFEVAAAKIDMGRNEQQVDVLSVVQNIHQSDTLCVIILPAPNGRDPQTRMIRAGEPIIFGDAASDPVPYPVMLAEEHPALTIAILRELGAIVGLQYEWDIPADAPNGADFAGLTASDPDFYNGSPNLIAWNGQDQIIPGLLQKLLPTPSTTLTTLEGGTHKPFAKELTKIYQGGRGYRDNFYRCAPDCVMRTRFDTEWQSSGTDPVNWRNRTATQSFCVACRAHLANVFAPRDNVFGTHFSQQKQHFERMVWSNGTQGEDLVTALGSGPTYSFDENARRATDTDDFWGYDITVDPAEGLIIENLRDYRWRNNTLQHDRPVATKMHFRDLAISYEGPNGAVVTRQALNLAGALQAGNYTVKFGHDGKLGRHDDLWQEGFLLTAEIEIPNLFRVTVEQSICLRRAMNDFDPTCAVVAIKIYPELTFSYEPLATDVKITAFHGCIWSDVNTISDISMHGHDANSHQHGSGAMPPDAAPQDRILTSWFAEIDPLVNGPSLLVRPRQGPVGWAGYAPDFTPTTAFYAGLFAYWYKQEESKLAGQGNNPDAQTEEVAMEIVGVRHPKDYGFWNIAAGTVPTLVPYDDPNSIMPIVVTREARQGQYDNVHNHGWMGWALNPPHNDSNDWQPLRMAPVCGQACLHLHWRWLRFSGVQYALAREELGYFYRDTYAGWGTDPATATSHTWERAPLIPPNQRLRVAVTPLDTKRGGGSTHSISSPSVLPATTVTHGSRVPATLDRSHRALWYDVDVEDHIVPGEKHVLFEMGTGYACDHAVAYENDPSNNGLMALTQDANSINHIRQNAVRLGYDDARSGNAMTDPFDQVMMYVYGGWMFHVRDANGNDPEQVPTGDWNQMPVAGQPPWPFSALAAMEDR